MESFVDPARRQQAKETQVVEAEGLTPWKTYTMAEIFNPHRMSKRDYRTKLRLEAFGAHVKVRVKEARLAGLRKPVGPINIGRPPIPKVKFVPRESEKGPSTKRVDGSELAQVEEWRKDLDKYAPNLDAFQANEAWLWQRMEGYGEENSEILERMFKKRFNVVHEEHDRDLELRRERRRAEEIAKYGRSLYP